MTCDDCGAEISPDTGFAEYECSVICLECDAAGLSEGLTMSVETSTCPHCQGRQRGMVHLNTTTGGRWEDQECSTCRGTGLVSREVAERIAEGERRREDRKARLMTLRQEAERLGITPQELSRIENGRE